VAKRVLAEARGTSARRGRYTVAAGSQPEITARVVKAIGPDAVKEHRRTCRRKRGSPCP